jgi:hypothetical protein
MPPASIADETRTHCTELVNTEWRDHVNRHSHAAVAPSTNLEHEAAVTGVFGLGGAVRAHSHRSVVLVEWAERFPLTPWFFRVIQTRRISGPLFISA